MRGERFGKENFTYLSEPSSRKGTFRYDHSQGKDEGDKAVSNVAEHNSKQEWESDHREQTGINLLIGSDAVTVHDSLKAFGKFVRPVEGWRCFVCGEFAENRWHVCSRLLLKHGF